MGQLKQSKKETSKNQNGNLNMNHEEKILCANCSQKY